MANGRIRRSARRGIAAAVLGWLCVAVASVAMAPGASAAKAVTIEIKNVTPPVASVDAGGTVTFVNRVAPVATSVSVPLVGQVGATIRTDVAVTFFGQKRALAPNASTSWTFPQTTAGSITYTYTVTPESGLPSAVAAQVVDLVKATKLKDGGAPVTVPYTVQTIVPDVPNLPSVNVPPLPSVEVPEPPTPDAPTPPTGDEDDGGTGDGTGGNSDGGTPSVEGPEPIDAGAYTYGNGSGAPKAAASDGAAAAAFDPTRFSVPSGSTGNGGGAGGNAGSGGLPGGYDGASVPVFGELAGVDGALDEEGAGEQLATTSGSNAQTLPVAALAAVVALATVTAALVRTQQAHRSR